MTVQNMVLAIHTLMNEFVAMAFIGLGYHAQATKQSWAKMIAFMNDAL